MCWIISTWVWTTDHATVLAAIVSAVAACTVAWFTITLASSTKKLWETSERQAQFTLSEFISAHRPKIIVHSVEITTDNASEDEEGTVGASVVYFNVGDTPARIIEINGQISMQHLPLRAGLGLGIGVRLTHLFTPESPVESGIPNYFAVFSNHTLEAARFAETSATGRGQQAALVCIGQIVYEDGNHTRRETGFCRRLDAAGERWLPMNNAEYEYGY